jgi:hypothetical protein
MQLNRTKLIPNEFTTLILKARGPRRPARDPGSLVRGPASQRWRLGTVTPAVGPWSEQNYPTPIEPEQHYRQAVRWLLYCPWPVVLGFRSAGLILLVQ